MPPAIDVALVRRLLAAQLPQWADLPLAPAEPQGWDHRTFRLGADMAVRLPSAEGYAPQVAKEQRWLPYLAPRVPLPIPAPLAMGRPGEGFPWPWSVYRWLDGVPASYADSVDLTAFVETLAHFLAALQRADPGGGPAPGLHSAWRGGPLLTYDGETRRAVAALAGEVDAEAATAVWEAALTAPWPGPPVWFHGDVAAGNLLVRAGRLGAIIDFGCSGVGDPACDLAIAWTLLAAESRAAFRAALSVDDATWARGRGWALWKALITLAAPGGASPHPASEARRILAEVLAGP